MSTDNKLKLALAKMLPNLLCQSGHGSVSWYQSPDLVNGISKMPRQVHETEWLYVCWLVEQTLNKSEKNIYRSYFIGDNEHSISASWQQRAQALAKVKGIEV